MLQLPCGKKLGEVPEPRSYAWLRWEVSRLVRVEAVNGEWQRMVVGRPWLRSAVFEPPPLVLGGSRPLPTPGRARRPGPGASVCDAIRLRVVVTCAQTLPRNRRVTWRVSIIGSVWRVYNV